MQGIVHRAFWGVELAVVFLLAAPASSKGQNNESLPQAGAPPLPLKANVIHGQFARRGQTDWAVLCSKAGQSTILIFWGKASTCAGELNTEKDDDIRYIEPVSEADILGDADPPTPGLMKHQAIDDGLDGKGSTVYYCTDGQWKVVAGAD